MNDNISPIDPKIVINKTTGELGGLLHQCYFQQAPNQPEGVYNFFTPGNKIRAANIVSGQDFNFTVADLNFHVIRFHIDESGASGHWLIDTSAAEPEGTFQAQSGVGDLTDDDEKESADVRPTDAILIHDNMVTGGSDKDKLKHCYFVATAPGGPYDFYSKHDNLLQSGLTSGTDWSFTHDSIDWTVTSFLIDDEEASGHWSNPDNITNEQDGTFQAQSGVGPVGEGEESASAASA
jgi:hypothetical protein